MRVDFPINKTISILTAAQITREQDLHTVAHNIANAETKGFHAFYTRRESLDCESKNGEIYTYPMVKGTLQKKSTGSLTVSHQPYSVSLKGPGYFAVKTPRGIRYTRNGDFKIDKDFNLLTKNNYPVLNKDKGAIKVTSGIPKIESDGSIIIKNQKIDVLGVFEINENLEEDGENLLKGNTEAVAKKNIAVAQGWLEDSNVSAIEENMNMIEILRHFEQAQHLIDESDQAQKRLINLNTR